MDLHHIQITYTITGNKPSTRPRTPNLMSRLYALNVLFCLHRVPLSPSAFMAQWQEVSSSYSPPGFLWSGLATAQQPQAQGFHPSTQLGHVLLHSKNPNQIRMDKICCVGDSYTFFWTLREEKKKTLLNVPPRSFQSADLQTRPIWNKTSITSTLNVSEPYVTELGALWELIFATVLTPAYHLLIILNSLEAWINQSG